MEQTLAFPCEYCAHRSENRNTGFRFQLYRLLSSVGLGSLPMVHSLRIAGRCAEDERESYCNAVVDGVPCTWPNGRCLS